MSASAKWPEVRLADYVDVLAGFAFKSKEFTDDPNDIPLVKGANVHQGYIDWADSKYWPRKEFEKHQKFALREGDVVIAMDRPWIEAGLKYSWIKPGDPQSLLVQRVSRLRGINGLLTDYVRYLIGSNAFTDYIKPIVTGVTVPHISPSQIKDFRFCLPPLETQRKIASILSAYDDLIENNTRRIKNLEEMARMIYFEWFVNFRFPGHEQVRLVDSPLGQTPEGWEAKPLEHLIDEHIGGGWGKEEPEEKFTEPAWVIRGTDIPEARYCQTNGVPFRYHSSSNLKTRRLKVGDIVFEVSGGSKGQPVGRSLLFTKQLHSAFANDAVICASFCKRVKPHHEKLRPEILYLSFVEGYTSGEIEEYQVQSTGISNFKWTEYLQQTQRAVPPQEIQDQFCNAVTPMFAQIATLGLKSANLRQTRDLLLPKLISGEIDVTDMAIEIKETAA